MRSERWRSMQRTNLSDSIFFLNILLLVRRFVRSSRKNKHKKIEEKENKQNSIELYSELRIIGISLLNFRVFHFTNYNTNCTLCTKIRCHSVILELKQIPIRAAFIILCK